MEAEHLLTVHSAGTNSPAAIGMYGTEVVVATADGEDKLHFHRPFCKTHEVAIFKITRISLLARQLAM